MCGTGSDSWNDKSIQVCRQVVRERLDVLYCEVRFHKPWRDCQKNRHGHTSSVRGGFDRDGTNLCVLRFSTSRQVSYFWSRIFRVLFHVFNPLRYTIAVSQELSTASTHPKWS